MAGDKGRVLFRPVTFQVVVGRLELVENYPGVIPVPGQGLKKHPDRVSGHLFGSLFHACEIFSGRSGNRTPILAPWSLTFLASQMPPGLQFRRRFKCSALRLLPALLPEDGPLLGLTLIALPADRWSHRPRWSMLPVRRSRPLGRRP